MAETEAAAAAPQGPDDVVCDPDAGEQSWVDGGRCDMCGGACDGSWDADENDWEDEDDGDDDLWDEDDPDWDAPFPVVRTDEEVLAHTCALVAGDRDGPFAVWVMFLDGDGTVLPVTMPIDGPPPRPPAHEVDGLLSGIHHVLEEATRDGSAVVALVRRGGGDRSDLELAWTRALTESADRAEVRLRAVVAVGRARARILFTGRAT